MRPRYLLISAGCLLGGVVYGCGGGGPVEPDDPMLVNDDGEVPGLAVESTGLTAAELLADPLLRDMLEALRDERRADAITAAVEATYESLAREDLEAARERLGDAYEALDRYETGPDVDDEDFIHLDASERFLDEVEAMIDGDGPPDKDQRGKKPGNKRV